MTKRKILSAHAEGSLSRAEVRRAVKKILDGRGQTTDIERLAKVMGWRQVLEGPDYIGGDNGCWYTDGVTVACPDGTLTDSGWKALVLWLWDRGDADREGWDLYHTSKGEFWAKFGKPTDDELIDAVLEVAGAE